MMNVEYVCAEADLISQDLPLFYSTQKISTYQQRMTVSCVNDEHPATTIQADRPPQQNTTL